MRETNDGFVIAEKDLELRGPGELLGTRQTGLAAFRVADLARDAGMLPVVQRSANSCCASRRRSPTSWWSAGSAARRGTLAPGGPDETVAVARLPLEGYGISRSRMQPSVDQRTAAPSAPTFMRWRSMFADDIARRSRFRRNCPDTKWMATVTASHARTTPVLTEDDDRTIPLLIDTDPGVDDALALLMAFNDPQPRLVGADHRRRQRRPAPHRAPMR